MKRARLLALCAALLGAPVWAAPSVNAQPAALGFGATPAPGSLEALDLDVAQAQAQASEATTAQARAQRELEGVVESRNEATRRLRDRARALYRMTRAGVLPLAGGFEAMLTHVGRVERLERMVSRDAEQLDSLRARADTLREETGRLASRAAAASARAEALAARRAAVDEELRAALLATGTYPGGGYEGAEPAWGAPSSATITSSSGTFRVVDPEPSRPGAGFESARGSLALPIEAPRALRQASREDGQGLELDGARGAAVHCAAPGRVAFAERRSGWGRVVIVDHGGGYFTVYAGLSTVDLAVGQTTSRGTRLGMLDGEPLFFQVRRGARALDPMAWLGL